MKVELEEVFGDGGGGAIRSVMTVEVEPVEVCCDSERGASGHVL